MHVPGINIPVILNYTCIELTVAYYRHFVSDLKRGCPKPHEAPQRPQRPPEAPRGPPEAPQRPPRGPRPLTYVLMLVITGFSLSSTSSNARHFASASNNPLHLSPSSSSINSCKENHLNLLRFCHLNTSIFIYFLKPFKKGNMLQSERGVNSILITIFRY